MRIATTTALFAVLLSGCAQDLSDEIRTSAGASDQPAARSLPGPGGIAATFASHPGGWYQARIDASGQDWIYLDLDSQTQVFPDDPASSDDWDIAHRGVDIKLNGGSSGTPPGGGEAVVFADKVAAGTAYPWTSVDAAPPPTAVTYHADAAGETSPDNPFAQPAYAMNTQPEADEKTSAIDGAGDYGWYHYSGHLAGSRITARDNVAYIIRTLECRYISLRLTAYYNETGADGHPQYDLIEIPGPSCAAGGAVAPLGRAQFTPTVDGMQARVDASDEDAWVYIDLANALQLAPTDPATDPNWDLALKRTDIRMNGGSSDSGTVALHDLLHGDWDAITAVPADADFHADEPKALAFVTYPPPERTGEAACGDINGDFGWYYYSGFCAENGGVHTITPRDVVYVLRGRDGARWKLRMLGYYDEAGSSAQPSFEFTLID